MAILELDVFFKLIYHFPDYIATFELYFVIECITGHIFKLC